MHIKVAHLTAFAALAIPVLAAPLHPSTDLAQPGSQDVPLPLGKREPAGKEGTSKLDDPKFRYGGALKDKTPPKRGPLERGKDQRLPSPPRGDASGAHRLPTPEEARAKQKAKDKGKNGKRSTDRPEEIFKREPAGKEGETHKLPDPPADSKYYGKYWSGHKPPKGGKQVPNPKAEALPRPASPKRGDTSNAHRLPTPDEARARQKGKGKRSIEELNEIVKREPSGKEGKPSKFDDPKFRYGGALKDKTPPKRGPLERGKDQRLPSPPRGDASGAYRLPTPEEARAKQKAKDKGKNGKRSTDEAI